VSVESGRRCHCAALNDRELVNVDANGRDGERVRSIAEGNLLDSDLRLLTNAVGRIKTLSRSSAKASTGRPRARRKH